MGAFPDSKSAGTYRDPGAAHVAQESVFGNAAPRRCNDYAGDSGSAARFFYCAKASKRDRDAGLEGMDEKPAAVMATTDHQGTLANDWTGASKQFAPTPTPPSSPPT